MAETLPVLVVEDDDDLREALTDTLELSGYPPLPPPTRNRPWPGSTRATPAWC
jgi:CheY-like chemotaxis protein